MQGLPAGFDYSPFVGSTLDLVAFSENTVTFRFGECLITVDASYAYCLCQGGSEVYEVVPPKTTAVLFLIGLARLRRAGDANPAGESDWGA